MESSNNVNNSYFNSIYKDVWKKVSPAVLNIAETDFIQDVALLNKGDKVLDIMCGYGRHAVELAKRGIEITAVDNLPEYINEITDTANDLGLPIIPIIADVLHMKLEDEYDAAICMGNSFAFFDKDDTIRLLKKISAHLKTGGVFIINSWMIAEIAIRYYKEKEWYNILDYKCILAYKYHLNPSRIESEQTIIAPDGSTEVVKGIDYIYSLNELDTMLREAGLKIKDTYSTPKKRIYQLGDPRIYIVTEKLPVE
jgi:SAM-dependent methyltransferase